MGRCARPPADRVRRHPGGGGRRGRRDEARSPRPRLLMHEVGTTLRQGEPIPPLSRYNLLCWDAPLSVITCLFLSYQKKRKAGSSLLVLGTGSGDVLALDVAAGQWKWKVSDCHPG